MKKSILDQIKFYHDDNLQLSWINLYGSVENASKALLYLIRYNIITFPFSDQYIPSPEIMFQNIINYQPNIIYGDYKTFYRDKIFKGQAVRIKSEFELHDIIDGITYLFIEDVRIKAKKIYAKKSTYECWIDDDCLMKILRILLTNPNLKQLTPKDF